MPNLDPFEVIVLLVIVLVIFGTGRIGELGGAVGRTIREFKSSVKGEDAAIPPAKVTEVIIHDPAPTVVSTYVPPAHPVSTPPPTNAPAPAPVVPPTQVVIEASATPVPKPTSNS